MSFIGGVILGRAGTGFISSAGGSVTPPPPPLAVPQITSAATASGQAATPFSYQITASRNPTSFGASGLPPNLSVNTMDGLISGTPLAAFSGPITVTATNSEGTGSRTVTLTIAAAPQPPVITSALTRSGQIGVAFSYTITATNNPTTFNATNLLPWMTRNGAVISGTPTALAFDHPVHISAGNVAGTDTKTLEVTIAAAPALAPVITSALAVSFAPHAAVHYTITANNAPTSFNAIGLPAWLTRIGAVISGTAPATPGVHNIQISATNTHGTDTKTLVLTITAGWEVTHTFPNTATFNPTTGRVTLNATNWAGWQSAFDADMTDAKLYLDPPHTPADLPVNLYSKYSIHSAFTKVPFDNWGPNSAATNTITEWGFNSGAPGGPAIYIVGSNSTGNPIELKLVKE